MFCASMAGAALVDVVVVGAGLSGAVAAAAVHAAGRSVAVLEGRARAGGRTFSVGGADGGASWVWPHMEPSVSRLASTLDLELVPQHSSGDVVVDQGDAGVQRLGADASMVAPFGEGAFRLDGGAAEMAKLLLEQLPQKTLMLGCEVHAVAATPEGGVRVEYSGGGTLRARIAVLAAPPRVLLQQIKFNPPLEAHKVAAMESCPTWMATSAKLVVACSDAFWRQRGLSGLAVSASGPGESWWEACDGKGGANRPCLAAFVSRQGAARLGAALAEADGKDDATRRLALRAQVLPQLSRLFRVDLQEVERLVLDVHFVDWRAERLTNTPELEGGSHDQVGNPTLGAPAANDTLLFAGTETERCYGHMEGAVRAGERAAREALQALSQHRSAGPCDTDST